MKHLASITTGLCILALSCGESTNTAFVKKSDRKRSDVELQLAQIYYDEGKYDSSLSIMEDLQKRYPTSEKVLQLLSVNYLAKAGVSFFDLIKKMIDLQKTLNTSKDTSDLLGTLSQVLAFSMDDVVAMSSEHVSSDNSFLKDLDLYYPAKPGTVNNIDSPRNKVKTLYYTNKAIQTLCPLAKANAAISSKFDTNDRYNCEASTAPQHRSGQTLFVYAFSHLIEAIMFHLVLMYDPASFDLSHENIDLLAEASTSAPTGHLIKRAENLNSSSSITTDKFSEYVDAVVLVKADVDAILSTDADSMLTQTVLDFNVTAEALKNIPGVPKSVSESITTQIGNLTNAAAKVGTTKTGLDSQTKAFREQLNTKFVPLLKDSITKFNEKVSALGGTLTADQEAQRTKVCDAYTSIVSATLKSVGETVEKPTGC